jgi:hypothetical protein
MTWSEEPFPIDLKWVSKRRTRELVDLYEARRRRLKLTSLKVQPPWSPVGLEVGPSGDGSLAKLAVEATDLLRPETGTLQQPNRFIRMTLDYVHLATFEVPFAWPDGSQQRVSTLFSSQWVDGVGRVFVALFGSPHNILGDMEPKRYATGRVPSNVNGLYRIIDSMREPEEIQLSPETLTHPSYENDVSDEDRVRQAALVVYGLHDPLPAQRLDLLAECLSVARNVEVHVPRKGVPRRVYELGIVGAALWAGTPANKPDWAAESTVVADGHPTWPVYDQLLYDFLDGIRSGAKPAVPDVCLAEGEEELRGFATWFVRLGRQFDQEEHSLLVRRRRSRWNPRRYSAAGRDPEPVWAGETGIIVPLEASEVLVTRGGDVIPVLTIRTRRDALYWPPGGDGRLEGRQGLVPVDGATLRQARIQMWIQAAEWIRRLH